MIYAQNLENMRYKLLNIPMLLGMLEGDVMSLQGVMLGDYNVCPLFLILFFPLFASLACRLSTSLSLSL